MEENQIKIKMFSRKLDANITRVVDIIDGKPMMYNKPMYCSCTGDTVEEATELCYDGDNVYCPECGNKSIEVYTYEDWLKDEEETRRIARENIHLNFYEHSWETGLTYYKLSTRLDYETWLKVKPYFTYYTRADNIDDETDSGRMILGWVTTSPEKVEEVLEIPLERTLKYRNDKREEKLKKQREEKEELENLINKCKEPFVNVEVPEGDFDLNGVKVENPLHPHNIYGGGEWWYICDDGIWFVKNNGFDGADWSWNNVRTSGAGAIGRKVDYDEDLFNNLMKLKKYK